MSTETIFFATNRRHEGKNRWNPKRYSGDFSANGYENLRFGQLTVNVDDKKKSSCLSKGDGEKLSAHITKQAAKANISAYNDLSREKDIAESKLASTEAFKDIKKRMEKSNDVVIYIHGYSVSWEAAVGGALALQMMLNRKNKGKGVMVVLFTWPSDGSKLPWAYKNDRDDAVDSGKAFGRGVLKLRDFLGKLMVKARKGEDQLCNQEIHLICHSMGNYVLQNTLTKLIEHHKEHYEGYSLRIFENIFLCAPDIDEDVLEPDKPMGRLNEICKNVTVYYNTGDVAMYFSDYTKGNPDRLGNAGAARLQVLHNRIHQVDCSSIVSGLVEHSYYLWDIVNDDIRYSIEGKAFDDDVRNRKLKEKNVWLLQK